MLGKFSVSARPPQSLLGVPLACHATDGRTRHMASRAIGERKIIDAFGALVYRRNDMGGAARGGACVPGSGFQTVLI
jgi:hypothetical protein